MQGAKHLLSYVKSVVKKEHCYFELQVDSDRNLVNPFAVAGSSEKLLYILP